MLFSPAYADGTTFLLKNVMSVTELFDMIDFKLFWIKFKIWKCEIAGISALKGVHVAAYDLKFVDLTSDALKILLVHFSDGETSDGKNFFEVILDIQNNLKSWRIRSLTIEGKISVFKSLVLSKVVYFALLTVVSNHFINELIKF